MKTPGEHFLENSQRMSEKFEISIVVVGDSQCGKTQLINRFQNFKFSKVGSNVFMAHSNRIKTDFGSKFNRAFQSNEFSKLTQPGIKSIKITFGSKSGATQSREERIMLNRNSNKVTRDPTSLSDPFQTNSCVCLSQQDFSSIISILILFINPKCSVKLC